MKLSKQQWSEVDRIKDKFDKLNGIEDVNIDFLFLCLDKLRPKKVRTKYKRVNCDSCNGTGMTNDTYQPTCRVCGGFGMHTIKIRRK